jgi:hypothetical protein
LTPQERIENEHDDEDEKDCSKLRASLKVRLLGATRLFTENETSLLVARGWPGNPGSDGASPYRLERRSMLRAILLVVVLVHDLLWEAPVAARMTRAARFGRSLALPP